MNQSFPCTYGPIYHGTIYFYFLEKYLKKFFVLPTLPSNEKNSSDHHNSYNKGPNLALFSFMESPSNSLLTIKFPKNHITSSYHKNLPKTTKAIFWHVPKNKWDKALLPLSLPPPSTLSIYPLYLPLLRAPLCLTSNRMLTSKFDNLK
jgi:hypothetical protein